MITKQRASEIISEFDKKKILVIGDLILDRYLWGEVERISPEAPVPVVDVKKETVNLGGACNVAWNVSYLGAKADIVGVIGIDENGKMLKKMLEEKGITPILIEDPERPTTEKTRIIAVSQQLLRIDRESKERLSTKIKDFILEKIKNILPVYDAVIISDYGKGVIFKELVQTVVSLKKPVFVDPKPSNFKFYQNITIMTPNKKEAYECVKAEKTESLEEVGKQIMEKLKLSQLLITLGSEGMALFEGEKIIKIPAKAKKVFDVTGAGDTVISVLTVSKVSGASWEEAATLANYAGGWVVGEIGTVAIDKETLLSLIP
jgi:rfaE bifunctional protein kinase chain/domain